MPRGVNLKWTAHAVERWRERVSAIEGPSHIALAFAAAVTVPRDEPLPFPRTRDTTYHRHATRPDIYFVTAVSRKDAGAVVLVTVIDAGELWGVKRVYVAGNAGAT